MAVTATKSAALRWRLLSRWEPNIAIMRDTRHSVARGNFSLVIIIGEYFVSPGPPWHWGAGPGLKREIKIQTSLELKPNWLALTTQGIWATLAMLWHSMTVYLKIMNALDVSCGIIYQVQVQPCTGFKEPGDVHVLWHRWLGSLWHCISQLNELSVWTSHLKYVEHCFSKFRL